MRTKTGKSSSCQQRYTILSWYKMEEKGVQRNLEEQRLKEGRSVENRDKRKQAKERLDQIIEDRGDEKEKLHDQVNKEQ